MPFRPLLVVLFLFSTIALYAQTTFNLRIQDAEDGTPIEGAFYAVDTLYFGVSDAAGEATIRLKAPGRYAVTVSHVAYVDTVFQLGKTPAGRLTIRLRPATVRLAEINVSGARGHKFRTPEQLVRKALKQVTRNYPNVVDRRTGLYREVITYDDCPVNLNEAVLEMEVGSYRDNFKLRKAWRESWDRYYASYQTRSNGRFRNLGIRYPEGTQQYAALDDRYRILRSRYSLGKAPHDFYYSFEDGPLTLLALDKARLGYDYLDPGTLKEYAFTLVDSVIVNGAFCYHLHFQPADDLPASYFGLNKQQQIGVFTGELYIDLRSLAIVRFKATNTKAIVRNFATRGAGRVAPAGSLRIGVDYAPAGGGKWKLARVISRAASSNVPGYSAVRTLYLTDEPLPIQAPGGDRWRSQTFKWSLHNLTRSYNEAFWSAFGQSSFYRRGELVTFDCPTQGRPGLDEFRAPFAVDTIRAPTATPLGDLRYVKEKRIKKAWEWLEDPTDSATTAYLRWENDYYDQYFRWNYAAPERVAEQFSRRAQGLAPSPERAPSVDTLLKTIDGQTGFYERAPEKEPRLLFATETRPPGYAYTNYGRTDNDAFYFTIAASRTYDEVITVYDGSEKVTDRDRVDDFRWRGDTLYVTRNDELLRTHEFSRWTAGAGWQTLLKEDELTRELRLVDLPAGNLILLSESLTEAHIHRFNGTEWAREAGAIPTLFAGAGMRGRGCNVGWEQPVDFVYDCRTTRLGTCVSAQNKARHEVWARAEGRATWARIGLPPGITQVSFDQTKGEDITLTTEGVGSYGRKFRVNFALGKLDEMEASYPPIDLAGYRDSIVWVKAPDGAPIPCQLRWKTSWQDSLRGTLLKVYAAYGTPALAGHSEQDIALMNLGHAITYVYARGGGTRGVAWYDAGRAENKLTGCKDYLAAVKFFSGRRHPLGPTPVTGYAQSAGGPLLGYAVNEAPELFAAAVFDHAFLDVEGAMSRPDLPLTTVEYPEWGDPANRKVRDAQASYSPYANVRERAYPPMLFLAGRYDRSTPYWQIGKFVAAARKVNTGDAPILFHTSMRGSHPGTPFGPGMGKLYEWLGFVELVARGGK